MKSVRFFDRRAGYSLGAIGLLLGAVLPGVFPAFASAGTLTTRSITMSSSVAGASGADYEITFAPTGTSWQDLVIDWCSDSPIIGYATCAAPAGFNAKAGVTVSGGAAIGTPTLDGTNSTASHTVINGSAASTSTSSFTVTLNGVHNPTSTGTFYARIYTYADPVDYTDTDTLGTTVDTGAVALSATEAIGVTAYVKESMTFCVSGVEPSGNCGTLDPGGGAVAVTSPSLELGVDTGNGSKALSASTLSTGQVWAQMSTNASNGASVNLQSDATSCGGLYLNGDTSKCNIAPNTNSAVNFSAGTAKFGLEVGSATTAGGATDATGTLAPTNSYGGSVYFIDYVAGNGSGVTGPYGSAVFNSSSAPVSNKNIPITFGTSINNNTPAGKYGATLRLIAVGTF